jgi:hypothetical protein
MGIQVIYYTEGYFDTSCANILTVKETNLSYCSGYRRTEMIATPFQLSKLHSAEK